MALLTVPIIDVAPLLAGDAEGRRQVARAVDQACKDIGFLIVVGHGVDPTLCQRVFEVSREFFELPLEEKLNVRQWGDDVPRGYSPVAAESLSYSRDKAMPPDLKESLSVGPLAVPEDPYYHCPAAGKFFERNRWPERPAALRDVWSRYYRVMEPLAARLMGIFALALDLPELFFHDKFDKHKSVLRVINYPPQTESPAPGQLRAGEHSDYGTLTIVRHEEDPRPGGLQVLNREGAWVDVPEVGNSFVVNIGDMMMRWTNDRWISTMHRVVNPPRSSALDSARLSLVFFHELNYDAVVECLPSCRGARPAQYPPVTSGDYLHIKFTKTTTFAKGTAAHG